MCFGNLITKTTIFIVAAKTLQIFDLEAKAKVKTHIANEDILFWKWINPDMIGMVTETAVHHWSLSSKS